MRLIICLCCLFFSHLSLANEAEKTNRLRTFTVHLNKVLEKTDLALLAANDLLANQSSPNGPVIEATLERYVKRIPAVRSIIVTEADGTLVFDTHRKISTKKTADTPSINLRDRDYFIGATADRKTQIYKPVIGRSSGVKFIPMSRPVYVDNDLKYIVVAIISPNRLIHSSAMETSYGGVSIYKKSGDLLAVFPDGVNIPSGFYKSLGVGRVLEKKNIVPFHKQFADSRWSENDLYDLVVVYTELMPSS